MITPPSQSFNGSYEQQAINHNRLLRMIKTLSPSASNTVGISRTPQGTVSWVPVKRNRPMPLAVSSKGWSGVVVFDSQRGKRVTTVAGIRTDFLRIHVSDASAGLLEYSDGSDLEAWPDGCIVRKISGIVGDLYVG